jgi:ABC-2 type transport system ATP-binding protein
VGPPALAAEGLQKSFGGTAALVDLSLEIQPGEIVALLGRNGAGKSTFVNCVTGLLRPDRGAVRIFGADAHGRSARARRAIGVAPQDVGLFLRLPVAANVQFFAELAGMRPRQARHRTAEVLDELQIGHLAGRSGFALSGGERRRVHAACALVHRPPLLLLDEPTAGADVEARSSLLAHLRRLAEAGTAICYATHYLQEVVDLGASVALVHDGRLLASGSPAELIARHGSSTAELVFEGAAPGYEGAVSSDGRIVVPIVDPHADVAAIVAGLGPDVRRLRELIVRPASLEQVFRNLTGLDADELAR